MIRKFAEAKATTTTPAEARREEALAAIGIINALWRTKRGQAEIRRRTLWFYARPLIQVGTPALGPAVFLEARPTTLAPVEQARNIRWTRTRKIAR